MKHSIRVVLAGVTEVTDAMTKALSFTIGSEAAARSEAGVVSVDFPDREADTPGEAAALAVADVERAGYKVAHVVFGGGSTGLPAPPELRTYHFTLILADTFPGPDEPLEAYNEAFDRWLDDLVGALLREGCDDTGVGSCGRTVQVGFYRKADSLASAVASAVDDVIRAGYPVERIDVETRWW